MVNKDLWFGDGKKGKIQINSIVIYKDLYPEIRQKLNHNRKSAPEIVSWIESQTISAFQKEYNKNPTKGALNNALGRWNEFIVTTLFSEIALEINQNRLFPIVIFSLPNSRIQAIREQQTYSRFISLLKEESNSSSFKVLKSLQDKIFFPSPDYILVQIKNKNLLKNIQTLLEKQAKEPNCLDFYSLLESNLNPSEIKAIFSLKTSNRPDRRYQPLFEAATIKAIAYLLKQDWKYYMIVSNLPEGDRIVFDRAISPHGIAMQKNIKLVDGAYLYNRKNDLQNLIINAL